MLVTFDYYHISGDFSHENIYKDTETILEYRMVVYDGIWLFDNGIILDTKFNYYSMQNNITENLKHQNINIKLLSKTGKAILIVKKAVPE
jgi:hypothetical protein